jgi:type 1 glutamine amidotransferase
MNSSGFDRRLLLKMASAAGIATVAGPLAAAPAERAPGGWEWGPMRWMQIAFTEDDPARYDKQFWLDLLQRTRTQGVCLTAGGVVAFYPTKVPFHHRSAFLGSRDMFGEMAGACKAMGLRVLARFDPHAMREEALAANPLWAARDVKGAPRRHPSDPALYLTCPNGPVTFEWSPLVLEEIVRTYPVDAIFGNRWGGSAVGICYCDVCRTEFRLSSGLDLPASAMNPEDPALNAYGIWSEEKRYAQLKLWSEVIEAANPRAFFAPGSSWSNLDPKRLRETFRAIYADRQGRETQSPAWANGRSAKEAYCIMPGLPISGSFAVGETSTPYRFMDSVQSNAEILTFVHDGIAHGLRPWMVKFKAEVFDKRWVPVVEKAYQWHARNEEYFRNTENFASVAMLHSVQSATRYRPPQATAEASAIARLPQQSRAGNDDAVNGFYQALVEARIPFAFAHEQELAPERIDRYKVLVLPNAAALSDKQCAQIRDYVAGGGSIVATHETSLYDERGKQRANFGLADLFGCDFAGKVDPLVPNSYINVHGPHPLTRGLDDTPRIIGGTKLVHVSPRPGLAKPALTLLPSYPSLPMEALYPRNADSGVPMVFARSFGKGRVVYFPADLDRAFWELSTQDHSLVFRNAVLWASGVPQPMVVAGPGLVDVSYWRQQRSLTAHLVNLNNPMAMRGYMREILPVGPYTVDLQVPAGARINRVQLLEADREAHVRQQGQRIIVEIPRLEVHEVVAIDLA